jgi:hypothetical protein
MTSSFLKRSFTILTVLCCNLLLLSACATSMKSGGNIEKRAMGRWDALLSADVETAYEYLSPGYRSSVSLTQYHRSLLLSKVNWTGAKYIESDCEETVCSVKISLDFTVYGALPGVSSIESKQTIKESWVLVKGSWYLVPKK